MMLAEQLHGVFQRSYGYAVYIKSKRPTCHEEEERKDPEKEKTSFW